VALAIWDAIFKHLNDADLLFDFLRHQGDPVARADRGDFRTFDFSFN